MSDSPPETLYLSPSCCTDLTEGRTWSATDVWPVGDVTDGEHSDGTPHLPPHRYVLHGWRPMETAPRDGSLLIGLLPLRTANDDELPYTIIDIRWVREESAWWSEAEWQFVEADDLDGWFPAPPIPSTPGPWLDPDERIARRTLRARVEYALVDFAQICAGEEDSRRSVDLRRLRDRLLVELEAGEGER